MSIPKEPRQLMINLMYLVLTALLALNISAEVMNAFFTIDKGINNSNSIVERTNSSILSSIQQQADAYDNEQNQEILDKAKQAKGISEEFVTYVEDLKNELFQAAGGPSEKDPSKPKRIKDKDVTTRLLVGIEGPNSERGQGYELRQKIEDTRQQLLALTDNDPQMAQSLPLKIDTAAVEKSDKEDWVKYNFFQMPVAAVMPILTKIQNDAKASSTSLLNYYLNKMGVSEIKFDKFQPVISARSGYVIRGEQYSAEVFLSAYSSSAGESTKIFVNGNQLPVEDGKAQYETTARRLGTKSYNVRIVVTNPLTGESEEYEKEFEYEVGERSVAVSADKMNVFYIGVDNPISVSAAGVSSNDLRVNIQGGGGSIQRSGGTGNYIVNVSRPEKCQVVVSGGGLRSSKEFRVKRIPDPVARLGKQEDGEIGNGTFKAQQGLIAWLDDFDFDARCEIQGFELVYVPARRDPISVTNPGGTFNSDSRRLINMAKPGDRFFFNNVKARCPGDRAGRKVNSLVFRIK